MRQEGGNVGVEMGHGGTARFKLAYRGDIV